MHDPRIDKLADLLLDHSCELQPGEKVLIEGFDLPEQNLLCALVEGAARRGGDSGGRSQIGRSSTGAVPQCD